jgi:hypothetical protein
MKSIAMVQIESLNGLWHLIKLIAQQSSHRPKIEDKAIRTIEGGKGKVPDCGKKIITSGPSTSKWKSYSEE